MRDYRNGSWVSCLSTNSISICFFFQGIYLLTKGKDLHNGDSIYNINLGLLVVASTVGIILMILLIGALKGPRKLGLILQQICIIAFLSLEMWKCSMSYKSIASILTNNDDSYHEKEVHEKIPPADAVYNHVNKILVGNFFASGFYFEFYFVSLLNCLDINKMVCNPFEYKEYSQWGRVSRRMIGGIFISFSLASHKLIDIVYQYFFGIRILVVSLTIIVIVIGKVIFSVVIVKVSLETRKKLLESADMGHGQNSSRRDTQKRIFYFSLVPLLNNILSFWPDVIEVVEPLVQLIHLAKEDFVYESADILFFREDVIVISRAVVFFIISFSSLIGYLIFFPSVRRKFFCKQSVQQE